MGASWNSKPNNSNYKSVSIAKSDTAKSIKVSNQQEKKTKTNYFVMIGILVVGMIASWGIGVVATSAFAGIGWVASHIIGATTAFAIDLGSNIISELYVGRLYKSRMFLFLMPVLGMEFAGKIAGIIKIGKNIGMLVKGLEKLKYVEKGKVYKVPSELIKVIKDKPAKFLENQSIWMKHQKIAYKGKGARGKFISKNEQGAIASNQPFGKKYIEELTDMARKEKWATINHKQILFNQFKDESIFPNAINNARNKINSQFKKRRQSLNSAVTQEILGDISAKGGLDFVSNMAQEMTKVKLTMFKNFAGKPSFETLKGTSNSFWIWINQKLKLTKPKVTSNKESQLYKMVGSDIEIATSKGKELFKDSTAWGKTAIIHNKANMGLRILESWTRYGRYINPITLARKLTRETFKFTGKVSKTLLKKTVKGKAFLNGVVKLNKKTVGRVADTFRKYTTVDLNKILKNETAEQINGLTIEKKMLNAFDFKKVGSTWILGYNKMIDNVNPNAKMPLFIFFNPLKTRGIRKNKQGKKPVWSSPMTPAQIKDFESDAGRYYLNNIAYGYDYSKAFDELIFKTHALPIQNTLYTSFKIKRNYTSTVSAIKSLQRLATTNAETVFKYQVAPTLFRAIASQTGAGVLTTPFIRNDVLDGNFNFKSGSQALGSRRLVQSRRNQARADIVMNKNATNGKVVRHKRRKNGR